MKIKNSIIKLFLFTAVLFAGGCETIDLDQTEDPSGVADNLLNPVYVFNYVQLQLPDFVDSANSFTQRVTRQMAMTGGNTYDNAFQPVNFNNNWNTAYRMLNAIKLMEPRARANGEVYALGASKVIRVYVLMTLVDLYGDIPVTEALQGNDNLRPHFDKSADVYKQLLVDLDEAISILGESNVTGSKVQDLYYTGQEQWIKLANTLKLKMYNNARLAGGDIGVPNIGTAMNAIFAGGLYIDEVKDDFAFRYGNSRFSPNTRHPMYNDQYELGGGAYIANYFMWAMSTEKDIDMAKEGVDQNVAVVDPRTNFYFFKQKDDPSGLDPFTLPGRTRPAHYDDSQYYSFYIDTPLIRTPYSVSNWIGTAGIPGNGYLGRDHGDNSGIPPDNNLRTVGGVYPIGGKYGLPASVQTGGDAGALGAGIMPIILSSFVHFIKAEAILTAGVTGDAKAELLKAINQSIDKTILPINNYPIIDKTNMPYPSAAEDTYAPGTLIIDGVPNTVTVENYSSFGKINKKQRNGYINFISNFYDAASNDDKLECIIKEYYLAAWGNGIEPYNNYRRTGFPSNFQPTLEPASGDYFYTALYPGESVNNNPNTPANVRTRKVFWDKANITLH